MVDVILTKGLPYFTQRNNKKYPLSSCNTTSMVQAIVASGISLPSNIPAGVQPEDYLTEITESKEIYELREKLGPSLRKLPPRQIHVLLSRATNIMMGRQITQFREDVPILKLVKDLLAGRASVLSTTLTSYGHVVCLSGVRFSKSLEDFTENSSLSEVVGFFIDDPYGNFFTGYKDPNGKNVFFPFSDFIRYVRPNGDNSVKWAHLFLEGGNKG